MYPLTMRELSERWAPELQMTASDVARRLAEGLLLDDDGRLPFMPGLPSEEARAELGAGWLDKWEQTLENELHEVAYEGKTPNWTLFEHIVIRAEDLREWLKPPDALPPPKFWLGVRAAETANPKFGPPVAFGPRAPSYLTLLKILAAVTFTLAESAPRFKKRNGTPKASEVAAEVLNTLAHDQILQDKLRQKGLGIASIKEALGLAFKEGDTIDG